MRWQERHEHKLAVSDITKCPRAVMWRINEAPKTNPPDKYLRRLFYSGKEAEKKLEKCLRAEFGDDLQEQVIVGNSLWTGKVDFLTPHAVIEHKETGANKFKWGDNIPQYDHLLQVMAYKHLLDTTRDAILYYTCRANWAEYRVWEWEDQILWEGKRNGKHKSGGVNTTVQAEMEKLERWFLSDEEPPRHDHPFYDLHCTSMYSKNAFSRCDWFDRCWAGTEYEGKEKFEIPKELGQ